jgi:hypothetical protein
MLHKRHRLGRRLSCLTTPNATALPADDWVIAEKLREVATWVNLRRLLRQVSPTSLADGRGSTAVKMGEP